jgi:hypothetical protein
VILRVNLSSFEYAQGRFLQAAIWRCLGGLLLQLISAKIFIFAAGPTGSGVGANFLMKTGGQEKRPPKPCSKTQGK